MNYIHRQTREIATLLELKQRYNASIPAGHSYEDWVRIQFSEEPVVPEGHQIVLDDIVEQDGAFFYTWKVEPVPTGDEA